MSETEDLREQVTRLAAPHAGSAGVDLVDVEVRGARGSRVVRLVADSDDGLDVDMIAELSRRVGAALDEEDLIDGAYTLEVTSPGVDRPLRDERSFRRNIGRDVRLVRNRAAIDRGEKGEVSGTLVEVDSGRLTLDVDGERAEIPFADLDHGRVLLPW